MVWPFEAYKKHYPPLLMDDVWRLEKIAENGKFRDRLNSNGIHTVKDLLRLLMINESSLHKVNDCFSSTSSYEIKNSEIFAD